MASGEALAGRPDAWDERTTGMPGANAPVGVCVTPVLYLPNRRIRDPYVRWCGRGEAVRPCATKRGDGMRGNLCRLYQ